MSALTTAAELMAQAKRFREAADMLEQAATILGGRLTPNGEEVVKRTVNRHKTKKKKTRQDQIREALEAHGAMTRAEILEVTGIPKGTLATYLKPDYGFMPAEHGKWGVARKGSAA